MTAPLMPKATAVWLVDNTMLTFRQIATFCELHELEVQAIADGDVAYNIIGFNPITNGQLTAEEIKRCEADPSADLVANVMEKNVKEINARNKKILTPSQRMDKPAAILWLIQNCPDLTDAQICKLVGTTKPTISGVREGTREDMIYLRAKNPVAIGLCSEFALDEALNAAQEKLEKAEAKIQKAAQKKKRLADKKKAAKKKAADAKKKAEKKAADAKKKAEKKAADAAKKAEKKAAAAAKKKEAAAKKKTAQKKTVKKATKKTVAAKKAAPKKTAKKTVAAKKTVTKKATTKKTTAKKASPAKKTTTKKAAKK